MKGLSVTSTDFWGERKRCSAKAGSASYFDSRNKLRQLSFDDESKLGDLDKYGFESKSYHPRMEQATETPREGVITEKGKTYQLHGEEFRIGGGHVRHTDLSYYKNIEHITKAISKVIPYVEWNEIKRKEIEDGDKERANELGIDIWETLYRAESSTHQIIVEFIWDYNMTYIKEGEDGKMTGMTLFEEPCLRLLVRFNTAFGVSCRQSKSVGKGGVRVYKLF